MTRFLTPTAEWIARISLYAYMVPSIVLIIPFYIGLRMAGLINTHTGLILSYLSFTLPLGIWMMRACFQTIPKTMEEAAVVDGANRFEAFFLIALPQALPGLVSTSIFVFILCWGEYLYPVVLIKSDGLRTITVTLDSLTGRRPEHQVRSADGGEYGGHRPDPSDLSLPAKAPRTWIRGRGLRMTTPQSRTHGE